MIKLRRHTKYKMRGTYCGTSIRFEERYRTFTHRRRCFLKTTCHGVLQRSFFYDMECGDMRDEGCKCMSCSYVTISNGLIREIGFLLR